MTQIHATMPITDVINLVIGLVLGVLSIVLGVFAMWQSARFERKATSTLDAITNLVSETRVLTDVSLSHHKDFSNRMLDSLLSRDRYGDPIGSSMNATIIEEVVRKSMQDIEARITASVEEKVRMIASGPPASQDAVQYTVNAIRSDIRSLVKQAADSASAAVIIPEELRAELLKFRDFPAHYLILAAVIRESIQSEAQLESVEQLYGLGYWQAAFRRFMGSILVGTMNSFAVRPEFKDALEIWINENWSVLARLIEIYQTDEWRRNPAECDLIIKETAAQLRF